MLNRMSVSNFDWTIHTLLYIHTARVIRRQNQASNEDSDDEDEDPDAIRIDPAIQQKSTAWWADQISGCPSSLEETVMVLLDSGFTPLDCPVLAEKLKHVILRAIRSYVLRYKIEVPMSCTAFIIPGEDISYHNNAHI